MKSIFIKECLYHASSQRTIWSILFLIAFGGISTAQNDTILNAKHEHLELIPDKHKDFDKYDPNFVTRVNLDDSLSGFDIIGCLHEASAKKVSKEELPMFIKQRQKIYLSKKYPTIDPNAKIIGPPPSVFSCNNESFESGSTSGWTGYNGYNSACTPNCTTPNAGATTAIVTAGTDACTGISTVAPGGGSFSCRLGNDQSYGAVNAIQQTFLVSSGQTMFTYQYAIILENPVSGHIASEMPYFSVEVRDQNGNFIPCGNYDVQYANGAANFLSFSNGCTFGSSQGIYRDWTTVTVDLGAYIGQNITIKYIVSGCGQGGHFGYAYIDGNCSNYSITGSTAVCSGVNATLSAPPGMGSYSWTGPGIVGATNQQTITANTAGTYSCSMVTIAGCPAPGLTHTLTQGPSPVASFTNNTPNCNPNFSFTDASSITTGSVVGWSWDFGDGNTSSTQSPSYSYTTAGTYTVTLTSTSDMGCTNTYTSTVTVPDTPTANFTYAANGGTPMCAGVTVNFTDASTTPNSTITGWQWNFGDSGSGASNTSTSQNPSHTYSTVNTFPVTFTVTNSYGCTATSTQNVVVTPDPVPNFTSTSVCQGTTTSFTNNTPASPAIATTAWDFTTDGSTDNGTASPTFTYPTAGTYTATLTSTSTAGCVGTYSAQVVVHPNPVASFTASTVCEGTATSFDGSGSSVANPDNIAFYNWTFGDASSNSGISASHTYSSCGTYTANLVVVTNNNCTNNTNVTITVNCIPTVAVPTNTVVCPATVIPTTTLTSTPAGATYAWTNDLTNIGLSSASGTGDVPTFTTTNTGSTQLDAHITVTPTSPQGCVGPASTYTISVKPTPVMDAVADATYCPGDAVAAAAYNTTPSGSSYSWTNSDPNIGLVASGTSPYPSFPATNSGSSVLTGTISVTPTLNGCIGLPITYKINVNPTPVVSVPADAVYCPNESVPASGFSSVPAGATFNWTNSGSSIGITSSSPGQIASFMSFNTGASILVATINVTPTLAGCVGLPVSYNITVNPTPHVNAINDINECPNTPISTNNITSTPSGATFDWTNNNTTVGLSQASGTASVPSFTTSNSGSSSNVATITITPTLNNCVGPDSTYTITVRPTPVLTVPADASYCPNVTTVPSPGFSSVPSGATVAWTNNNTSIGLGASNTNDYAPFTPLNTTGSNQIATITAIPTLAGCTGSPKTYSITVYPKPITSVPASSEACPADAVNGFTFGSTPNDPLTTYAWTHSNNFVGLNQGFGTPATTSTTNSFTASNNSTVAISTTFTVTTSLNGCFSDPKSFSFTVNPLPTPDFSASHTCKGDVTTFTSLSTVGTGSISYYQWDFDNNGSIDASSSSATANNTYNSSGAQNITHTAVTDKGCKKSITKTMYVNPNPQPMLAVDQPAGCPDLSVVMGASVNPSSVDHNNSIVSWAWDVNSDNSNDFNHNYSSGSQVDTLDHVYTNSSSYSSQFYQVTITATTDSGCVGTLVSSPTFITVYAHPVADFNFGPNDPLPDIDNPQVEFYDQSQGATDWAWSFNDPNSSSAANFSTMENPAHYYESYDPATYDVTLVVNNGQCWDSITKPIEILPNWTFYIPNAFSPNGDGVNDGFRGTGVGIDSYSIYIFDRWGNMIWTSNDLDEYWDGRVKGKSNIVQQDTYVWKVKFKDLRNSRHEYKGTVSVIR